MQDVIREAPLTFAAGGLDRACGLLCTQPNGNVLMLLPCHDIHTYGMGHKLDVAFVDRRGNVIESHSAVPPRSRLRNRRARVVVERFSSEDPWFAVGDSLGVVRGERACDEVQLEGRCASYGRRMIGRLRYLIGKAGA